jgi:hypothetical protein
MTTRYGRQALRSECDKVKTAREHTRNDTLSRASRVVGELVAGGEVTESDARNELTYAAEAAGLGRREAESTIRSGLRYGARSPRARRSSEPPEYAQVGGRCRRCHEAGSECFHEYDEGVASWRPSPQI